MESKPIFSEHLEYVETSYWSRVYQSSSSKKHIAGSVACALPDIDILAFNRVVGLGLSRPAETKDIDEIIDFYRSAGSKRFFVQIAPFAQPGDISAMLLQKGFKHHNNWAKLTMPVHNVPKEINKSALEIRRVEKDRADEYGHIIVQAFEWPRELVSFFAGSVGLPGYRHYFAIYKDKTIAAAALYAEGKFASMAIAGTLPEYRGLGAQKLLLWRRIEDAWSMGCSLAVSETGENRPDKPNNSYRNMVKVGFAEEYLRKNYLFVF
jgi:GNAT superfamily N-acetyltransferase